MPVSPSAAQSAASPHNGRRSHGPSTPDGRERAATHATRHGLRAGPFRLLPDEDPALFTAHLDALLARWSPADVAERHHVEQLAWAAWRQRRLLDLETRLMAALEEGVEAAAALPSLATLARYAARIERDLRLALEQLEALRAARPQRPPGVTPERLRWLLRHVEAAKPAHAEPEAAMEGDLNADPSPKNAPAVLNRHARRRMAALARHNDAG
jgi:hypothetical protein